MKRGSRVVLLAAVLGLAAGGAPARAATDGLTAMNVVPPGESGNTTLAQFALATAGAGSFGPHTEDQQPLYAGWSYKPMQFQGEGQGTPVPGDANVTIRRDPSYGVPTITGATDYDAFYGLGYAMAQDRLFQMEAFRHVGHGTLAELTGPSGIAMDEDVRRFSEGPVALMREFHALPAGYQDLVRQFVDGINEYIAQVQLDPLTMPAEFTLLGDLPIKPWTVGDVLAFGEYAGRFFGEFGHGELADGAMYQQLVARYGRRTGERIFDDLVPLNDPRAPASISRRDGLFPRHTGRRVRTRAHGYANHAPGALPPLAQLSRAATTAVRQDSLVHRLQRTLAIPRFGSNAAIVSGRLTADGKPMLYGGPQTGWAVPGFFWEAEIHSPARDERGVYVPAIPVMVIGRNESAAWTVTSALDANADTFVEQLDPSDRTYRHDGQTLTVEKRTETIGCRNPPTSALPLLSGQAPTLCPSTPARITVYRTVHGPSITGPDAGHRLYVRQSVVDGRLLSSLAAWDTAGRQTTTRTFGDALRRMTLGFNFFYVDDHHDIAYWHTGAYPIRPANADPRLPLPGDGRYDWQGFERWSAHPHVIDPRSGFLVNWNNKPAAGWYSQNLEPGGEGGIWGDQWESVPLAAAVRARVPLTLQSLGQVPRDVAYIDNPARLFLPYLRAALAHATDPQLVKLRPYLDAWNGRRDLVSSKGFYSTPAVVFFDRFVEELMRDVSEPVLGAKWFPFAGLDCATCRLTSVDNLSAPTYKFEQPVEQLLVEALRHRTRYRWVRDPAALMLQAARDAAAKLTAAQGADPAAWNEPVEQATFTAQGGISVAPITPLFNRGSYGQVVEAK